MIEKISKRVSNFTWVIPLGLFILSLIAYLPLAPGLGIYWDDWPSLWFLHFFGPTIFPKAFAIDRPAQGWLFLLTTSLVGESMFAWQVFGIFARWLCSLAFAWAISLVWRQRKVLAATAAALFIVYPGFSQQFIPITYGHQFLVYGAFLASLGFMLLALRHPERYWLLTVCGLALDTWSMFALEYFFGLELIRPALLWAASNEGAQNPTQRLRRSLSQWLPYALIAGLFLVWRITHVTPRGNITLFDEFSSAPQRTLITLGTTILQDALASAATAWERIFTHLNPIGVKPAVLSAYLLVIASGAAATFLLLRRLRGEARFSDGNLWQPVLIGLYALLIGGWPVWATNMHLELNFPWDRFTLPLMFGSILIFAGLLDGLPLPKPPKFLLISLVVGLSSGVHLFSALDYRLSWSKQQEFFWQLAWRAPVIQPNTLVLISTDAFKYVTDNSLSAPLNWIYAPEQDSERMPYQFFDLEARLGTDLPALSKGIPIIHDYRATHFEGSTSQAVVIFFDPPRCLKVIDPLLDGDLLNKPEDIAEALPLSRPHLIQDGELSSEVERLFGPPPEGEWCYYFEKAELAGQLGDWGKVAALADQALAEIPDLEGGQAYELVTFIHGYAHSGRWEEALALSQRGAEISDKMPQLLCDLWQQFAALPAPPGTSKAKESAIEQAMQLFQCFSGRD